MTVFMEIQVVNYKFWSVDFSLIVLIITISFEIINAINASNTGLNTVKHKGQ